MNKKLQWVMTLWHSIESKWEGALVNTGPQEGRHCYPLQGIWVYENTSVLHIWGKIQCEVVNAGALASRRWEGESLCLVRRVTLCSEEGDCLFTRTGAKTEDMWDMPERKSQQIQMVSALRQVLLMCFTHINCFNSPYLTPNEKILFSPFYKWEVRYRVIKYLE